MLYHNTEAIKALKVQARELGIALYGAFELTGRCNFDCKMCYVHVMNAAEAKKKELTTEQLISVMDEAYQAGMLFALLTGGECLLRPDFKELYLHLYNKGVVMSVNTNGALIDEEMARFFGEHRPEWVQISLYGCGEEGYERVTGVRGYSRVIKAIELLRAQNVHVKIAVTPSLQLLPDLEGILRYLVENKLDYRMGDELFSPRDGVEHEDPFALTDEQRLEMKRTVARVTGREIKPTAPELLPKVGGTCTEATRGMPCNAGTLRFVLTWDGKMIPCMSIPEICAYPLRDGFTAAWNEIHGKMQEVLNPVECEGCVYRKKCTNCPVMRYNGLFSGHCRPEVCEFTLASCAAGVRTPPTV